MTRRRAPLAAALALLLAAAACEQPRQLLGPDGGTASPQLGHGPAACHPTGTGLTARVVNQDVIGGTIDVGDCDVGAFFDRDGVVRNARFVQPDADPAPRVQHLVRVEGAKVNVTNSTFDVDPAYVHQIVHVGFRDGATGTIAGNELTGFKRAGILLDGAGTEATVRRNVVTGVGENDDGWAENGIQVSRGASGTVHHNEVTGHWWDENSFVSSGIIVFGSDGVTVAHNTLAGNDAALVLFGDRVNALHNDVDVTAPDGDAAGIFHGGALVSGTNDGLRQNRFTTATGADVGIFVFSGSRNTKLIGNRFDGGFGTPIVDNGDATKLPKPFVP